MVIETQSPPSQSSQNTEDINSPHHPLFFHPNDHPGLLLISKKLLESENYGTWRRSLLIALSAKNKLKLINGEYEERDPNSELRAYWERANDMLISWILNTVSDRIYQLANEIVDLKQSNCTIEVYYHKLKGLWDEMDAIEAPYACTCKRVCEKRKENDEREQRKRQEEKQKDTHKQSINAPITLNSYRTPYNTSNNSSHRNNTPNPNTPSNNNQSDKRSTFRKGIICTYCKKEGHSKEECHKLLGYPVGHPLHKKYLPPSQRTQGNGMYKAVNLVMGESSNSPQQESPQTTPLEPLPIPDETHVYARMDQLQNQLNQDHDGYNTHGILHGGLYILPTVSLPFKPHQSTIQSPLSTPHLWHARLAYTSFPVI
ncbi:cysteine-rich receptor-like protein kinase 8 [Tanacetum coccineum]